MDDDDANSTFVWNRFLRRFLASSYILPIVATVEWNKRAFQVLGPTVRAVTRDLNRKFVSTSRFLCVFCCCC